MKYHRHLQKLLFADKERLILLNNEDHQWKNKNFKEPVFTRPAAVNIISGKMTEVMKFLNQLSRGAERKETYNEWTKRVRTWDKYVEERKKKYNPE